MAVKNESVRGDQGQVFSRRGLMQGGAAGLAAGLVGGLRQASSATSGSEPESAVKNGRIKQSLVAWCYTPHWPMEELIPLAKRLGCLSVELVSPEYYPLLKQHGLQCAIASTGVSFEKGFNNPRYHDEVLGGTRKAIDACAEHGFKQVIAFTGLSEGMTREQGADNCVKHFKEVMSQAEKQGVTLCLEMLNSRDASKPMLGHLDYQGDHVDYCVDIIKRVGSPNLKLLFDIYHVQIMDGDLIRRIREHREWITHVHTAGVPGRGELDQNQEINYPAVMRALLEIGYQGFVGQEYIPTRDPLAGLKEAIALCDV